jgi:hypothetical protein
MHDYLYKSILVLIKKTRKMHHIVGIKQNYYKLGSICNFLTRSDQIKCIPSYPGEELWAYNLSISRKVVHELYISTIGSTTHKINKD